MTDSSEIDAGQNSQTVLEQALRLAAQRVVERCDLLAESTDDEGR